MEPKPLPVPCDNCGMAIEPQHKLCIYCAEKAYNAETRNQPKKQCVLGSDVISLSVDPAMLIAAMAMSDRQLRIRNRQASVPRNHE